MKRLLAVVLIVMVLLAGCAATTNGTTESTQPRPTESPAGATEYTSADISAELETEIDKVMDSLGIADYEITNVHFKLESSDSLGDEYTFEYAIKADSVDLSAHGSGIISNSKSLDTIMGNDVSSALAWVARSADNKLVWSCTDADLYDWQTGELKP